MSSRVSEPISFGRRMSVLAAQHPDKDAIILAPTGGAEIAMSWADLDRRSNRTARLLAQLGVDSDSMIVVGLPNGIDHYLVTVGAWKLGALVLPLRAAMPEAERDEILELANPRLIVADWQNIGHALLSSDGLAKNTTMSADSLADVTAHPGKSIGSGGSTGRPKIIVSPRPWAFVPGEIDFLQLIAWREGMVQLVAGPLYHNSPFSASYFGLFESHTLVVMERFEARRAVDLIKKYKVSCGFLAPTMMQRIARLENIGSGDFPSIESIYHSASPCPGWLKRKWIELIGAEHLYEAFGSTEDIGHVIVRGDEWLEHPGSLGKPRGVEVRILDEKQRELPSGEIGEIHMRMRGEASPTYRYIGAEPLRTTSDGFATVGDMGRIDEHGYLFLADRRVDLIISGGENVYPAEVEAALSEHAGVDDVAVIGLPDDEWGKRVHAVVQPAASAGTLPIAELDGHCRRRLAVYKLPKSYEFVRALPRDPAGKIRRSAMVESRREGWTQQMARVRS